MDNLQKYRSILGVTPRSSKEEMRRAYKKKILITHPDKNKGNDTQFIKVQEAYEKLTNVDTNTPPRPRQNQQFRDPFGFCHLDHFFSFQPPTFKQGISHNSGVMQQEFVTINNGVKVVHRVFSNLHTGERTEKIYKSFN